MLCLMCVVVSSRLKVVAVVAMHSLATSPEGAASLIILVWCFSTIARDLLADYVIIYYDDI